MNLLKSERLKHNETQEDIASLIGVTQSVYSRYESEEIDISTNNVITLADHWNVTTDYLLGRESENNQDPQS